MLNLQIPCDVVISVVFLPGEDLIKAEKQTGSARWRREDGGTQDTSSCRKEAELCLFVYVCVCARSRMGGGGQTGATDNSL